VLHITDGESVAGTLRESSVPGEVRIYGDLLYEGPAPAGLSTGSWIDTRAKFLTECRDISLADARRFLTECEDTLQSATEREETVVWLDHRLSDQLILIRLLDWFGDRRRTPPGVSLICICDYAGIDPFIGLGQLTAGQLTSLLDTRLEITDDQLRLGRVAWSAFTSPDPMELESLRKSETSALPFLRTALRRHVEQFPFVGNGLSRTERQALIALQERPLTARQLFFAVQKMDDPLFMGDGSFFSILTGLARCGRPLVETVDRGPFDIRLHPIAALTITEAGVGVLEGREDHIRWNGINRWIGGVHLQGDEAPWRWDPAAGQLIEPR
jgi:hypothetical protein